MEILILGGTGAMGEHLVNMLSQNKIRCSVTTRALRQNSEYVTYMQGNAHNMSFLKDVLCLRRWDAIVDFMTYSTQEFRARASVFLESTAQYFYLSSSRVYADSLRKITEYSPRLLDVCNDLEFLNTDDYALSKARQENILFESNLKNWTIIRPYITYSKNRLQLGPLEKESWLYRALTGKTVIVSKDYLCKKTTLTYGKYVAAIIISLLGKENALGEIFNATSPESILWSDVLEIYSKAYKDITGKPLKVIATDTWNPRIGGSIYQYKYDRMYDRSFDDSKVKRYLSDSINYSSNDLYECTVQFLQNPIFDDIAWSSEAYKDRISKEFTSYKLISGIKNKLKYYIIRFGLR